MESCQDTRKLLKGRIISIEEAGGNSDVYDIEVEGTHNYVANGILISNSGAKTYKKVNAALKNAYYRYGFTGTFLRTDGTDMEMFGVISDVLMEKTTSELIEEKFLVRPHITVLHHQIAKGRIDSRARYDEAYNFIVEYEITNQAIATIARRKIKEGKQTLILVRRKAHGLTLLDMIPDAKYLSGDDPVVLRRSVIEEFENRETNCIIATGVFGEGIDIKAIDVLINARFQKTEIQTKQGIGRALRLYEGKTKAEVFDFIISGQKHLKEHSYERLKSYAKEKAFKIKVVKMQDYLAKL